MGSKVYLKGIAYELEEPRGIEQLQELRDNRELLATLKALGVAAYSPSRRSPAELAAAAITRTLWKAKVAPEAVDLLIYATSTFSSPAFYGKDIHSLIVKLRLEHAYPLGVTLSECANLTTALGIARDRLRGNRESNILVVAVDKVENGKSRIVPPEVSIASDAAASALLTSEGGLYELLACEQHMIPLAYQESPHEDFTQYLKTSARGIQAITAKTLEPLGKTPEDFQWLLTNNYNISVSKLFSSQTGFSPERTFTANIARYGHGFAADNLINLSDCTNEKELRAGDLLMLLASGPNLWGTAVLRKT